MAYEIERKFLISDDSWRHGADGAPVPSVVIRQGYLFADGLRNARIRTTQGRGGDKAFITIKGAREGITRFEFEYAIPVADAVLMLDTLCKPPLIEKTRHYVEHAGMTWEIDEFSGANAGLILAELELERADQRFEIPAWVLKDVTADKRYYNTYLAAHPYRTW